MLRITVLFALPFLLIGCGDKDDETCEDAAIQCSDDILQECVDGVWEESEDCLAADMICHDMGDDSHCMMEGEMDM